MAGDGERENFHRSARAPPATRRHAGHITCRYNTAGHSLNSRLCRVPGVVQAALKLVLQPIFEADFEPVSYGFRPVRRAHDAIAEIHQFGGKYLSQGHALGRDPPRPSTRSVPLATYA